MIQRHFWNEPNLAPTDVKRQHYVSKCYLRAFSRDNGQIRVVDLEQGNKQYWTNLANVAVESRYYDIEVGGVSKSTENWLAELEGKAVPILEQMTLDPRSILSLTHEQEIDFARFVAALGFRVPGFRKWSEEVRSGMIDQMKSFGQTFLGNRFQPKEANRIWKEWERQPDEWWLGEEEPIQPSEVTAFMLSEVQGYANLLRAMPWRVGSIPEELSLFTTDNPVARFLNPARARRHGAGFTMFNSFVPLSPRILLKIEPIEIRDKSAEHQIRGFREHRDFSAWETGFALRVLTGCATRFLYGDGWIIPRNQAVDYLVRIEDLIINFHDWLGTKIVASKFRPPS